MAEIAAARPCRQDQVVVAVAAVVEHHLLVGGVDVVHLSQQDLQVRGLPHHLAQGGGHIGLGHKPCGHLIEQGLEQVEIASVDQGDAYGFSGQGMGRLEAGEPPTHDHHMGGFSQQLRRGCELEKEPLRSHHRPLTSPTLSGFAWTSAPRCGRAHGALSADPGVPPRWAEAWLGVRPGGCAGWWG